MDTMKMIDDIATSAAKNATVKTAPRSISSYASKAIYYFPVLCSKTVTDKHAFTISANLEAAYSSFVQACFSMVPAVVVKGDNVNVEDYLKIFHQNVGINSGNEYYVGQESAMLPYEMFVNDVLNEASFGKKLGGIYQDKDGNYTKDSSATIKVKNDDGTEREVTEKNRFVSPKNFNTQELEKKNNLKPSIVKVDCTFLIQGNDVKVTIPVGVKTLLHAVNSDELCNHVMDSIANKGLLHNFIKYTTGEVMSLKDILFGISKVKSTVSKRNTEMGRWAEAIDHRKRLNRLSKGFLLKKPYLPNISLILSMDDINDIKHLIGYDLFKDTHRAVKFMKDNYLLTFVIADDATETAYVLYDGHTSYEELPYSAMRRENERTADAMSAISKSLGIR